MMIRTVAMSSSCPTTVVASAASKSVESADTNFMAINFMLCENDLASHSLSGRFQAAYVCLRLYLDGKPLVSGTIVTMFDHVDIVLYSPWCNNS
ncbi:hypothetical protein BDV06DRAFT_189070 [Aspergillus oleicola]